MQKVCVGSGLVGNVSPVKTRMARGARMVVRFYNRDPLEQSDRLCRRLNGLETI